MKWHMILVISSIWCATGWAWGSSDKVLLREVSAITLHQGQMTTGRRSSPVPQLKCVGGSAGCHAIVPHTVQCRNVGSDGYDVQWECKADMDDSYRFGKVQVTCEGYDYPDDPYVLKGSCGLEYTIDYTEVGKSRNQNYGGGQGYWKSNDDSSCGGWVFFLIIVCGVVYLICKMSPSGNETHHNRRDHGFRGNTQNQGSNNPPPYGFKPEYTSTQSSQNYAPPSYTDATSTGPSTAQHSSTTTTTSGNNSFWTGLGLGGLGGYLFGSRNRRYHSPGWGYGSGYNSWGSSWGSGNRGWGSSWGSGYSGRGTTWGSGGTTNRSSSSSRSSGTSRTASGFGGTSRR